MEIEKCKGYESLKKEVIQDIEDNYKDKEEKCEFHPEGCIKNGQPCKCFHHYCNKFRWVIDRAEHYHQKTCIDTSDILDAWEKKRNYWYMNYYQDCNQPLIKEGDVYVFNTGKEFWESVGKKEFRCPNCHQISTDPLDCNSGAQVNGKPCDWKAYGFFRIGIVNVLVKDGFETAQIFKPVAWEKKDK